MAGEAPETSYEVVAPTRLALADRLGVGRALRPLKQRRRSRRRDRFDTDATIEQYCETRILVPILTPAPERWFHELALVADGGPTMVVWRETMDALGHLLAHHGAFDRVTRWSLHGDDARVHLRSPTGRRHDPRELVDHDGRRLILVVSDCVGELWRGGAVWRTLREWGRVGPVALVQTLPSRLWPATALGVADVTLGAHRRGEPNNQLRVRHPWWWTDDVHLAATPVVTLDERHLASWARMVAGRSGVEVAGVVTQAPEPVYAQAAVPGPGPPQRVAAFRTTVSPEAFRLAVLLSSVDVSLPVARLVLDRLIPAPRQTHLAEVFASGLLRSSGAETYDFVPGVREVLQESLTTTATIDVWRTVAPYLEAATGQRAPFSALLDPRSAVSVEAVAGGTYRVAAELIARLGLVESVRVAPGGGKTAPASTVEPRVGVTLGLLGAEGHGKTTLLEAIVGRRTEPASPGARIDMGYLHWVSNSITVPLARTYHVFDWPTDRDVATALLSGTSTLDAALLVVTAIDGPTRATREHLRFARATGVSSIVVVLTKCDLVQDEEILELVELETREVLHAYGFPGDDVAVYRTSAAGALEGDPGWQTTIRDVAHGLDSEIPDPAGAGARPLLATITGVGRSTLAGRIRAGVVRRGVAVDFLVPGYRLRTTVESVFLGEAEVDHAVAGSTVRLALADVTADHLQPFMMVAEPDTVVMTSVFTGVVHVFSPDALGAGRGRLELTWALGERPWSAEAGAFSVDREDSSAGWPDDAPLIRLRLRQAIPVRPGLPFTIVDGNEVVAIGVVAGEGLTEAAGSAARLPHVDTSTAILIGLARSPYSGMPNVPEITLTVDRLADALVTGGGGFARSRTHTFVDPRLVDLGDIRMWAHETVDTLLVYYAGQSILDEHDELHLVLADSQVGRFDTTLPFTRLLEIVESSSARNTILILDTYNSRVAFDRFMALPEGPVSSTDIEGATLLAPLDPGALALTPALIDVLRRGIPDGPEWLRLSDIYAELRRRLNRDQVPRVRWATHGTIAQLALVRNAARAADA